MPARHARPKPAGRWTIPVAVGCVAVAALTSGPLPWLMLPAAAAATWLGLRQADRRAQAALAAAEQAGDRVRNAEAGADSWRAEADFLSAELAALAAELAATRAPLPAMSEPLMASSGDFVAHLEPVLEIRLPDTAVAPPSAAAPQPAGWQGVRVIDLVVRETRVAESAA